jgi:hypothetical protein
VEANNFDRRIRDLELKMARLEFEMGKSAEARERYIPVIKELVETQKINRAIALEHQRTTRIAAAVIVTVITVINGLTIATVAVLNHLR